MFNLVHDVFRDCLKEDIRWNPAPDVSTATRIEGCDLDKLIHVIGFDLMFTEYDRPEFELVGAAQTILPELVRPSQRPHWCDLTEGISGLDTVGSVFSGKIVTVKAMLGGVVILDCAESLQVSNS
nr:hypothetical protein BaRGS_018765 [Batillaria attramentaria]